MTVANAGTTALSGWTLGWSFAGDETITSLWSANYTQSGKAVTVTPPRWATALPAGGSATSGFTNSSSSAAAVPAVPAVFTLDGSACRTA